MDVKHHVSFQRSSRRVSVDVKHHVSFQRSSRRVSVAVKHHVSFQRSSRRVSVDVKHHVSFQRTSSYTVIALAVRSLGFWTLSLWLCLSQIMKHSNGSHRCPSDAGFILVVFNCCFTPTETVRTNKDGGPRTATSTSTQLLSLVVQSGSLLHYVHRDRMDIRDGGPRMTTSTFTQLLSSVWTVFVFFFFFFSFFLNVALRAQKQ